MWCVFLDTAENGASAYATLKHANFVASCYTYTATLEQMRWWHAASWLRVPAVVGILLHMQSTFPAKSVHVPIALPMQHTCDAQMSTSGWDTKTVLTGCNYMLGRLECRLECNCDGNQRQGGRSHGKCCVPTGPQCIQPGSKTHRQLPQNNTTAWPGATPTMLQKMSTNIKQRRNVL
jgi:hypothetical protein